MKHAIIYETATGKVLRKVSGSARSVSASVASIEPGQAALDMWADVSVAGMCIQNGCLVPDPAAKDKEAVSQVSATRRQRDMLLVNSDWTQLPDAPVNQRAWARYRKALREMDMQSGVFPTPPK